MHRILAISGPIAVGKSLFIDEVLKLVKGVRISTRELIQLKRKVPSERGSLQTAGDSLDLDTDGKWVADALSDRAKTIDDEAIAIIDSVRIAKQAEHLRAAYGENFNHIHLTARDEVLAQRYMNRKAVVREFATYDEARANATEAGVGKLAEIADLVIEMDKRTAQDAAALAIQVFGLVAPEAGR